MGNILIQDEGSWKMVARNGTRQGETDESM